jgi:hypothetical protein
MVQEAIRMTFIAGTVVLGMMTTACVKAYLSAKLLEKDADAFEKWQVAHDLPPYNRSTF